MARYFFDQNHSAFSRGHAGLEIDDPCELRREALRTATNDMSMRSIDEAHAAAEVTVRDEHGAVHLIVRVTCEKPDA